MRIEDRTPIVSVVMAVRNGMPYLRDAVESILAQTITDLEFIVINDGSTDDSLGYLQSVKDFRLRVISQSNVGPGASANRGMALARGEYIARMDADDVALPSRLERQLRFLENNPEYVVVGTQLAFLSSGRTVEAPRMPQTHEEIVRTFYNKRIGMTNASILCRREAANATRYRIAGSGEDVDFILRLAEKGKCANLSDVLYLYRIHAQSTAIRTAREVRRGACFAIRAAEARKTGEPEPCFDDFCRSWSQRGSIDRMRGQVDDWAFVQYRRSIIDRAAGKQLRGWMRLCAAGACRPATAARRLIAAFSGGIQRRGTRCITTMTAGLPDVTSQGPSS